MKICIPTEDDRGLDALLADHFGRAPFFTIVDRETKAVHAIENRHAEHDHGHCNPLDAIMRSGADLVICRGLGRGALARLQQAGVPVLTTDHDRVGGAMTAFETEVLSGASLEDACGGNGGCHDHH